MARVSRPTGRPEPAHQAYEPRKSVHDIVSFPKECRKVHGSLPGNDLEVVQEVAGARVSSDPNTFLSAEAPPEAALERIGLEDISQESSHQTFGGSRTSRTRQRKSLRLALLGEAHTRSDGTPQEAQSMEALPSAN